jgi:hypothetical protein
MLLAEGSYNEIIVFGFLGADTNDSRGNDFCMSFPLSM